MRLRALLHAQLAHIQPINDLAQDAFHPHTGILGEANGAVVAVQVNGRQLAHPIGKTSGVEVRLDGANGDHYVGALHVLPNTLGRSIPGVDATVVWERLVHGSFAHRCDEGWQIRLLDQFMHFVQDLLDFRPDNVWCEFLCLPGVGWHTHRPR